MPPLSLEVVPMPYTKQPGEVLTHAEAAHLIIREAQGEKLSAVPVRQGGAYQLAQVGTLTPAQRAEHRAQVAQVAAYLFTRARAPLSA